MKSVNPWMTVEPVFIARLGASFTGFTVIATVSTSVTALPSVLVTVSVSGPL
jgi:hypothetical protein